MREQEIEHPDQKSGILRGIAQLLGCQAGYRKKPLDQFGLGCHECQGAQCKNQSFVERAIP